MHLIKPLNKLKGRSIARRKLTAFNQTCIFSSSLMKESQLQIQEVPLFRLNIKPPPPSFTLNPFPPLLLLTHIFIMCGNEDKHDRLFSSLSVESLSMGKDKTAQVPTTFSSFKTDSTLDGIDYQFAFSVILF